MDRVILHCDMNGFFASVELLDHPELSDVPMAVCGSPDNRHGIILAKNEIAKKYGVVTAETLWQARRKCPDLQIVPPHHHKYKHYSQLINKIYNRYTDMVEPFSIDESWLDVTASTKLFGSGKEIADSIRNAVTSELGLTLSAGVSFNKFFAKMGSEYKKPDATTVITRDNYKDILWPLDIGEMFFVGRSTAAKLKNSGINTIGDLALSSQDLLVSMLGKLGMQLWKCANGLDDAPVSLFTEKRKIKSIGNGITFRRDLITDHDISVAVTGLADTVAGRMRRYQMKAYGIKVDVKDTSLHTVSHQKQLHAPTNLAGDIMKVSIDLIREFWPEGKPIRMLTLTGINLVDEDETAQISMFDTPDALSGKNETLERTMDAIRARFGKGSIGFAGMLDNDIGIDLTEIKDG